tara:strand:+ start:5522 stop:6514 length:993 start_codon:yes stop_codon:yes gene_type:complete
VFYKMKLATYNNKLRDGELIVVDKNLDICVTVPHIAATMQQALDTWDECVDKLENVYKMLNAGVIDGLDFDVTKLKAPLPRAYQWADGSAYVNHVELVRKARGATMPDNFWVEPLMYQGGSDKMLGPVEDIEISSLDYGVDFEAEVIVVTNDVPMGVKKESLDNKILLIGLVNDVSLRNLIPNELSKGFGFFQSKPASGFSPVFVTPDELGDAWDGGKLNLPLYSYINNKLFGKPNAGIDMTFDFKDLIVHAATTRYLTAGTIIGSGTVSNIDRSNGSSCIAEKRMLEIINDGQPITPFLQYNDTVKIEMLDDNNSNIFGTINQKIVRYL